MGLTKFPFGVSSFGIPQLGNDGLIPTTSGSYFWVDSDAESGGNGSYEKPYTTLELAYAACTDSMGDVIIMKPTHSETVSAATGIVLSKIGVSIIGLGQGALRPTFTLTGTAATCTMNVTGASQVLRNFIVTAGVDELVTAITVGAASVTIEGVEYRESSTAYQALSFITNDANANFMTVRGCRAMQLTAANGNAPCITMVGADDCIIEDNYIVWIGANNAATCGISSTGTATLRTILRNNIIHATGGNAVLGISMVASSTGIAVLIYARAIAAISLAETTMAIGDASHAQTTSSRIAGTSPAAHLAGTSTIRAYSCVIITSSSVTSHVAR